MLARRRGILPGLSVQPQRGPIASPTTCGYQISSRGLSALPAVGAAPTSGRISAGVSHLRIEGVSQREMSTRNFAGTAEERRLTDQLEGFAGSSPDLAERPRRTPKSPLKPGPSLIRCTASSPHRPSNDSRFEIKIRLRSIAKASIPLRPGKFRASE
jgi:hypothetical protein